MSLENPFRKKRLTIAEQPHEMDSQEVTTSQEHFSRSQEDGLNDEQREKISKIEEEFKEGGEYAVLSQRIETARSEMERIKTLPEGSREKANAAWKLQDNVKTWDSGNQILFVEPPDLWNKSPDLVRENLMGNPRFSALLNKLSALEEEAKETVAQVNALYAESSLDNQAT